jgi:RNA polymerase sigma-70 factor, ECF subfamily
MSSENPDQFVKLITEFQRDLYSYILMLIPSLTETEEVLQQTNLRLWKSRDKFQMGKPFLPWASKFAYLEVLAFRREKQRDRLYFDDALLEEMAVEAVVEAGRSEAALNALVLCSESLKPADRQLLDFRYTDEISVIDIAGKIGRTSHAVRQALFRIRAFLLRCVERRMRLEERG